MSAVGQEPGTEWDGHVLLLHESEDERLAALAAWVRRGLDRNEKVIYTAVPLGLGDSLFAVLEARGVDGLAAARDGRLSVLPTDEFYPSEGQTAVVERALAEGFSGVRLAGNVGAALTLMSPTAYQGVEQQMADLVRRLPVSALCQYPRATTTGAWLEDVVANHLFGVRQSTFATREDLDGLALRGEVDGDNIDVFHAVLTAASRNRSQVLWVDLAEVSYLDAGACWRLDDATRSFRAAGGHVLLVAPRLPVDISMRLMEVDELPGMHLVGGER